MFESLFTLRSFKESFKMHSEQGPILISACLLGRNCRYDGGSCRSEEMVRLARERGCVEICPEVDGGLPVPRPRALLRGGTGPEVVAGGAKIVFQESGEDVTRAFLRGAWKALKAARAEGVRKAYLKSKSPSCGVGRVSVGGEILTGWGVTAWLLREAGVQCVEVNGD
jgi:uncharacterized protein YbbK (DUF523 family)